MRPVCKLRALIEYVALFQQGDSTIGARKALLIEQRDQLEERIATMQQTLKRLNHKIENYGNCLAKEPELRGKAKRLNCTNTSPPQSSPAGEPCVFVYFLPVSIVFFGIYHHTRVLRIFRLCNPL